MVNRKYYIDELERFLVKAYTDDDKFVLETVTLIPKYRGGYHRNVFKKVFDNKDHANNYFKKIKSNNESLKEVKFPGMANGHVEY